jgi:hypothetical protein
MENIVCFGLRAALMEAKSRFSYEIKLGNVHQEAQSVKKSLGEVVGSLILRCRLPTFVSDVTERGNLFQAPMRIKEIMTVKEEANVYGLVGTEGTKFFACVFRLSKNSLS